LTERDGNSPEEEKIITPVKQEEVEASKEEDKKTPE